MNGRPPRGVSRRSTRPRATPARVLLLALLLLVPVSLLPAAVAAYSATTVSDGSTLASARYYSCSSAALTNQAPVHYALQEVTGTVVVNTGTGGSIGDGTATAGLSPVDAGPPGCGAGSTRAVGFDGVTGQVYGTYAVTDPQTFSLQLWFATTTTTGGKLIGFGDATDGAASLLHDRHVYMTDTGELTFGVFDRGADVVSTATTTGRYHDGTWHLMTATFSPTTGLRLYVDGLLQASDPLATVAETSTGYWRIGYDAIDPTWPGKPTSEHFQGALAHVSIYDVLLSEEEIADQHRAGS